MKKILLFAIVIAAFTAGCRKEKTVSKTVSVSYPLITFSGTQFYSIPVGGALPTISATASDTTLNERPSVVIDLSTLNNSQPGLYVANASAKNSNGYVTNVSIYVAVTNVPASMDISGVYYRDMAANTNKPNIVTKLATGLYMVSNAGGVDTNAALEDPIVPAYFAVLNDSTIDFGSQLTTFGQLTASGPAGTGTLPSLTLSPDTTFSYIVYLGTGTDLGKSVRTFVKR